MGLIFFFFSLSSRLFLLFSFCDLFFTCAGFQIDFDFDDTQRNVF